ncbi:PIF1-like helicase-domain-containing protein [Lipomyces japonicus]|uniref:PIF1-like helicase-domain-containing protein n=1 Tax=Lipomyces japonicus TaxID=56871 RepID=UPI0034CEF27F
MDIDINARKKRGLRSVKKQDQKVALPKPARLLAQIFLSEEQKLVLKMVCEQKRSIFFTGSAGTGKSVLLREIIKNLHQKYGQYTDSVAITASTGLAACNIGGVTLHSFAGIGLGKDNVKVLFDKVKKNKKSYQRWLKAKVLIMDEISMVDAELLDKLEALARMIRKQEKPFGGIQLIVTGDFFQLPPVAESGRLTKFAFEATSWSKAIPETICLTQVFRQKDQEFVDMLNEMRLGQISQSSISKFRQLSRKLNHADGLEPTELFPTRREVGIANNRRMQSLPGRETVYTATDRGTADEIQLPKLLSNLMAQDVLVLKVDAQVMLIKNMDETLVNGSLGKVKGFMSEITYAILKDKNNLTDVAEVNVDEDSYVTDQAGNIMIADGLDELRSRQEKLMGKGLVAEMGKKWPLVRFTLTDGTHRDVLIRDETWAIEAPNGELLAERTQLPLILAWALSIHKAQGQTLERVKVDLTKVFENGQAYVALSRATSRDGLQVQNFQPNKVFAHSKVINFYSSLRSVKSQQNEDEAFREVTSGIN